MFVFSIHAYLVRAFVFVCLSHGLLVCFDCRRAFRFSVFMSLLACLLARLLASGCVLVRFFLWMSLLVVTCFRAFFHAFACLHVYACLFEYCLLLMF